MTNIDMVNLICKIMGKNPKESIEFVKDRPGHDFRYDISNSKLVSTGFTFNSNFEENLKNTIVSLENQ